MTTPQPSPDRAVQPAPAATLDDVARAAKVHRTTVARALNKDPRVAPGTRAEVERWARELGYRMNPLVAALMSSRRSGGLVKHQTFGYVTAHDRRYGWRKPHSDLPDFFGGAAERAIQTGYKLEDFWLTEPGMKPERFVRMLRHRNVRGLLIGRMPGTGRAIDLDWSGFCVVTLGVTLHAPLFHRVRENHFQTAQTSLVKCRELGHRRIGLVFTLAADVGVVADMWTGGFTCEQRHLPEKERLPVLTEWGRTEAEFRAWFRRHRPQVIVATKIEPLLPWLQRLDLRVPDDVSLVELRLYAETSGHAGVYYEPTRIGATGIDILIGSLHRNESGVPDEPHEVLLPGRWIQGTTLRAAI